MVRCCSQDDDPSRDGAFLPRRIAEVSDTEDFLDVVQQLQQAEVRERLKAIVESNRGAGRSRRSTGNRGHRETVASLRQVISRREPKFSSLSSVSEASSEAPLIDSSQQQYLSAVAQEMCSEVSSQGAPASGEDNLSTFLEESSEDDRLSASASVRASGPHSMGLGSKALTCSSDGFATKEELSAVLACLRRVERKVDWLMSQERRLKTTELSLTSSTSSSLMDHLYFLVWAPAKATVRAIWPLKLFLPAVEMAESVARYFLF